MEVDEVQIDRRYYVALWDDEYEEMDCIPCGATFHRH